MDQQLNITNTSNTLEAIDVLKRNQSSIRERVLARKKGLVDPINTDLDSTVQTQEVVTPSASPSKRPLISPRANFNNIINNNNNNNNLSEKKPAPEELDQPARKHYRISSEDDIEKLLNLPSIKERERNKVGNELVELLERQSVKEKSLIEKFKTKGGPKVTEYCSYGTREDCKRERQKNSISFCDKIHFRRIIKGHTDIALGDCSYLDTCRHMKTCKFVHYEIDDSVDTVTGPTNINNLNNLNSSQLIDSNSVSNLEPQWICCDIRRIDMSLLGQFSVIMADPPWDIHMELPYGTLNDDEMRSLNVGPLQKNGWFFLWVTGRAMELGRECLQLWGYERVEEVIWVKTNQLQRIIRTGRTGHWLNHSKEHCLVGVKGNPGGNRFLDSDVIVAEVRETSRKPDEIYQIIERLSPATRKLELFGRPHNSQPGWLTLGNQLEGVRLHDPQMRDKITKHLADIQ